MHELSDPVASPRGPLEAQLRPQRKEQRLSVPELGPPGAESTVPGGRTAQHRRERPQVHRVGGKQVQSPPCRCNVPKTISGEAADCTAFKRQSSVS